MIVAEQKSLPDLKRMVKGKKKVLAVGCGTCVSVCFSGGQKETAAVAAALRTATAVDGEAVEIHEVTVQRQCVHEFVEPLGENMGDYDAVLSLACGVGVQTLAEKYPETRILPGLDTQFMGQPVEPGIWEERCIGCGNCVLEYTGGLCPITRCPKQLFNGPCGGSEGGMCEVDPSLPCIWAKIWDNAENLDIVDVLTEIQPPQDWSTGRSGGLRRMVVRDDLNQPPAASASPAAPEPQAAPAPVEPEAALAPLPAADATPQAPKSDEHWKRVCDVCDVDVNAMKVFDIDGIEIMLANLGDGFRAFPPMCPHMEEPFAESASLEDGKLTCSKHVWQWDLRTGGMLGMAEKPMLTYEVKRHGDDMFVYVEAELEYGYDDEEE